MGPKEGNNIPHVIEITITIKRIISSLSNWNDGDYDGDDCDWELSLFSCLLLY